MTLTPEQIKELKSQLSEQIKNLPENQKAEAQKQIDSMSSEALETMIKQQQSQQQIFRSIIEGKIPSKKIEENSSGLAVLEIKPNSRGHTIIIPKKQVKTPEKIPKSIFKLAEKISKRIIKKLKARDVQVQSQFLFGETIINLIPIYDNPLTIDSPRENATEKDLEEIYKKIHLVKKAKVIKITKKKPKKSEVIKLSRKIP